MIIGVRYVYIMVNYPRHLSVDVSVSVTGTVTMSVMECLIIITIIVNSHH